MGSGFESLEGYAKVYSSFFIWSTNGTLGSGRQVQEMQEHPDTRPQDGEVPGVPVRPEVKHTAA